MENGKLKQEGVVVLRRQAHIEKRKTVALFLYNNRPSSGEISEPLFF